MELTYRLATEADLITLVNLLADDVLGATRENPQLPLAQGYVDAFARITADPQQELTVVMHGNELIAMFQLSFLHYLTYQGGLRAQMEAVRVKASYRGQGIGRAIFDYAIQRTTDRGAHLPQLTTDKKRPDASRFYESLGFVATHEGMKRVLA